MNIAVTKQRLCVCLEVTKTFCCLKVTSKIVELFPSSGKYLDPLKGNGENEVDLIRGPEFCSLNSRATQVCYIIGELLLPKDEPHERKLLSSRDYSLETHLKKA